MVWLKLWQPHLIAEISYGEKTEVSCNSEVNILEQLFSFEIPKHENKKQKTQEKYY